MDSWVKLHRKLTAWEWYTDVSAKTVFIHLILRANWSARRWRRMTIQRGQMLTSRSQLAIETGLSQQQVRTALVKLESTRDIVIDSSHLYSVITVTNYDTFQAIETAGEQAELTLESPSLEKPKAEKKAPAKKAGTAAAKKAATPTPPPPLDCSEFASKWSEYETYRRERKLSKLQPRSVSSQWKKLASWGVEDAMESIDQTIANGWQGLFEPKRNNRNKGSKNGSIRNEDGWM